MAQLQVKQQRKIDEAALEQLLLDKRLWGIATKVVVNHDVVEQLYIEGKLTDNDLRSIDAGNGITLALKVGEKDIQRKHEGHSEQGGDGTLHDRTPSQDVEEVGRDD